MKKYIKELNNHIKEVEAKFSSKDVDFPSSGVITLTYNVDTGVLENEYVSVAERRGDSGNSGNLVP